jgi:hypothetical protein
MIKRNVRDQISVNRLAVCRLRKSYDGRSVFRHSKFYGGKMGVWGALCLMALVLLPDRLVYGEQNRLRARQIATVELDEHNVYAIPVSTGFVTTVSFPSEIEGLEGRNITLKGGDAPFSLSYTPKSYYFSVCANQPRARTNLNVVWNNKTYVLQLIESANPVYSVVFTPKPDSDSDRPEHVTPARLLGLLDKVKAFPLLQLNYPNDFKDVGVIAPKKIVSFGDFFVSMDKIYRFNSDDTLVFELTLTNKTSHEVDYEPQGFAVRVGNNVYYQSISDASGKIPPNGSDIAYFAVTGTPDGRRNDLSLKNDFTVIVSETRPITSGPATMVPYRRGYGGEGDGKGVINNGYGK